MDNNKRNKIREKIWTMKCFMLQKSVGLEEITEVEIDEYLKREEEAKKETEYD